MTAVTTTAPKHRAGLGPAGKIWLYNLVLAMGAALIWVVSVSHLDGRPAITSPAPWWGLALVFYLAEAYVVHVRFRREAHTISLSEIGLVLGLFVLPPALLLLAQLLGGAAAFAFVRRQRLEKLVFNVVQLMVTTSVALLVFRSIASVSHPFDLLAWGGALLAAVVASVTGILLVTIAIALAEGELSNGRLPVAAGVSILATIGFSNVVLIAIELARFDPSSIVLLVLPTLIGVAAFRSLGAQARRHEHLEFLYESVKATQGAPEFNLAVGQLLISARRLVRAEYAEIFLFPAGGEQGLRSVLGSLGEMNARADGVGPADEQVMAALGSGADAILLPSPRPSHPLDGYLAVRGLSDGIFAALRGEDGLYGLLVVGERSGDVDSFNQDDKRLLETFAGHASVMLENGRLERSLAQVTDLKERLRYQAFHDTLTGLPNRALLTERVEAAVAGQGMAAVLLLDLDDFKTINDTLGHAVGDEVLAEVARRIQRSVRSGDTAARLGGDEFAVLLETTDERRAQVVADSLLEAMRRPFDVHGRRTHIHASIGIALADSARSADELLRNADVAMYSAKTAGKHGYAHFEPTMHAQVRKRHEFAVELQNALERGEISVAFEPIVDLRNGRVVAFEALARWSSPVLGVVPPGEFIPIAEELGLMVSIGRSVLRDACRAARRWQELGPGARELAVCVNLSPSELANDQLAEDVARALFEARLPADRLMLELTESNVMWDLRSAEQRMSELRALGVRLVLDDFGTGHSSLERLDSFPLDAVKIAKPFVDRLVDPAAESTFIDAFVQLAQSLKVRCIAEGIEHAGQVPLLLDRGCTLGQGFHFARPMTADEVAQYLAAGVSTVRAAG